MLPADSMPIIMLTCCLFLACPVCALTFVPQSRLRLRLLQAKRDW